MQIDRNKYGMMLFMSKQVSLPKISSILQKMKISQKCDRRPFCTKPFNYRVTKTLIKEGHFVLPSGVLLENAIWKKP